MSLGIHQLRITLSDADGPPLRNLQVDSRTDLADLHVILRLVLGLEGDGEHEFRVGGRCYGATAGDPDVELRDEGDARLNEMVPRAGCFLTHLHRANGPVREHWVTVEAVLAAEPGERYPNCIDRVSRDDGPDFRAANRALDRFRRVRGGLAPVLAALREAGSAARLSEETLARAEDTLRRFAEHDPDALARADVPGSWAAGALHAVSMRDRRADIMAKDAARMFGISMKTASARSNTLRHRVAVTPPGTEVTNAFEALGPALGGLLPVAAERRSPYGDPDDPAVWVQRIGELLDVGERDDSPTRYRVAADLLDEHGAAMSEPEVRDILRRGLRSAHAPLRFAFYRAGLRHLGPEVRDWAARDRAGSIRTWAETGKGGPQRKLF